MAMMSYKTSFFVAGIGSALEVYPIPITIAVRRQCPEATDAQRLASDWYRVGTAIYSAMEPVKLEDLGGEDRKITAT